MTPDGGRAAFFGEASDIENKRLDRESQARALVVSEMCVDSSVRAGGRSIIGPDVDPSRSGLPSKSGGFAAMYPKWDGVFYPWDNIQFLSDRAGSHATCQGRFCPRLKCLHFLSSAGNAEILDIKTAVLIKSAHRLYVADCVDARILHRKLLPEWAGEIS